MKKKDKKKIIKIALIVCGILILCLLLLIAILRNSHKEEQPQILQITEEEEEQAVTNQIRNRGEKERMQIYIAEFIRHIEKEEYDRAYKKLSEGFKENFFKTEEAFIAYARKNYSGLMSVEYEDIQRQGTYYILTVTITNLEELETTINQIFIIHEIGLNDYELSFQVK